MKWWLAAGLVMLSLTPGCTTKAEKAFDPISWQGNQTFEDGGVFWDGSGEAFFRVWLDCDGDVYAWYSTDEGTQGALDVEVRDGSKDVVLEGTFGDDNHEKTLQGAPGRWRMVVHSHEDFSGNGLAYLECRPA